MKKITLLLMLFITSLSFSQITLGTGDDGSSTNSPPINPYYGYSYSQSIYLASELSANSGNITSIDLALNAGADISTADEMVDVWIGHTAKTDFSSTTDWVDVSTLTQVLTNGTITSAGDLLTITFSTPFAYNGTDNIIIAVDANEDNFGSSSDYVLSTNGPTAAMSLIHRSDSVNGDPSSPPSGTLRQNRGNITFNGITTTLTAPLCAENPTPAISAMNVSAAGGDITISWDAPSSGDAPSSYEVFWGTTSGMLTSLGTTSNTTEVITSNQYSTTYYWQIVPSNVGGTATGCAEWSFTTEDAPPPPVNDDCSAAIALVINTSEAGSTTNATGSSSTSCDGTIGNDVWYTVIGDGGDLTISVDSPSEDSQIGIFESNDCAGITLGSCDFSDDPFTNPVVVTFPSVLGTKYYIQVGAWISSGDPSDFDIVATTSLSVAENKIDGFSIYPNPVNDRMQLSALDNIKDINVYNLLGQEVLRTQPNVSNTELDMTNLPTGMYVVKVQVGEQLGSYKIIKE